MKFTFSISLLLFTIPLFSISNQNTSTTVKTNSQSIIISKSFEHTWKNILLNLMETNKFKLVKQNSNKFIFLKKESIKVQNSNGAILTRIFAILLEINVGTNFIYINGNHYTLSSSPTWQEQLNLTPYDPLASLDVKETLKKIETHFSALAPTAPNPPLNSDAASASYRPRPSFGFPVTPAPRRFGSAG